MTTPVVVTEDERLRALHDLDLVGTSLPGVDRLCRIARDIFDVPVSLVTLIDEEGRWFMSRCGVPYERADNLPAFCNHTILSDDVLLVHDALLDERFVQNAFVTGAPFVRFYAGAPLILAPGIRLGTLCVVDTKPRDASAREIVLLKELAEAVVAEFHRHRWERDRVAEREAWHQAAALQRDPERIEIEQHRRLHAQAETSAKVGTWVWDLESGRTEWSDGLYSLLGYTPGEIPATAAAFRAHIHPDDRTFEDFDAGGISGQSHNYEHRIIRVDGERRWLANQAEILRDSEGKAIRMVGVSCDITERKAAEERLWNAAHQDALTGLPNRALFQRQLERSLEEAARDGTSRALLMIDLDDFKDVNDTLGHDVGDRLLRLTADRLRTKIGAAGTVSRLGGDEFAIIMEVSTPAQAEDLGVHLLDDLKRPHEADGQILSSRASIGIALFPDHDLKPAELMKDADIALYRAKAEQKNVSRLYSPVLRRATEERVALRSEIRRALQDDQFVPFYQPLIALDSGAIAGFESLARWAHPARGLLTPNAFDLAFEEPALSTVLTGRMFDRIVGDMSGWLGAGHGFGRIALNFAAGDFSDPDMATRLIARLSAAGIGTDRFKAEVTETVFLGKSSCHANAILRQLHDAGVEVALDDFGTGYASLVHLKQYPVSQVKIDRSFIQQLEVSTQDDAIVSAVLDLGRALRLTTVAEGIETVGQLRLLRDKGCAFGQGYLFAKPMAASRVPHFIETWERRRNALLEEPANNDQLGVVGF